MPFQYVFDAVYNNNFELLKELLSEEVMREARNTHGFNLLHAAIGINRLDIIEYILQKYSAPVNDRCHEGRTPFLYGCETETIDYNILTALINHGADINVPNQEGITPLHTSCRNGNTALTKLLIGNGVVASTNENNGYTPLHYIALSNCVNTLNLLINYKKYNLEDDLNLQDFDGCTALMLAVDVANFEVAKELIQNGADCNIIGRDTTALHLAVITQQNELFELLWTRTNFKIIKQLKKNNNLVKLLIKYGWFFPDRLKIFFSVLDHPNILEILGEDTKILTAFFYRIRFVKYIQEIDIVAVVNKFLQIGVQACQHDLRIFFLNFYKFQNSFDILKVLIKNGTNIDDESLLKFVIELYPKLLPKLMPFCVQNGPLNIIIYFTEILRINKDMIKLVIYMLYFCTPGILLKRNLKDHLTNFCFAIIHFGDADKELLELYDCIISCLKMQDVASLRELSRDVFRSYLSQFCQNSQDFLTIIRGLELSKDIVNIIQCTLPVNMND